jgi:hypothetical protein
LNWVFLVTKESLGDQIYSEYLAHFLAIMGWWLKNRSELAKQHVRRVPE